MKRQTVEVATVTTNSPRDCDSFKNIDWHDSSDRRWLMNHLHHCMMNRKKVTLTPHAESN